jgi:hypothetical protein
MVLPRIKEVSVAPPETAGPHTGRIGDHAFDTRAGSLDGMLDFWHHPDTRPGQGVRCDALTTAAANDVPKICWTVPVASV